MYVTVSVAVTAKEGLVVGMRSMPGNPYDGHMVDSQIEQIKVLRKLGAAQDDKKSRDLEATVEIYDLCVALHALVQLHFNGALAA
jgi:hypothetical protein